MKDKPWLPYVLPFGLYMGFLLLQSRLPDDSLTWMYPIRALTIAGSLWYFRRSYAELLPTHWRGVGMWTFAIAIGIFAILIWIGIDPYYPKLNYLMTQFSRWLGSLMGQPPPASPIAAPAPFDPTTISSLAGRYTFIAFRIFGAAVVVAFMEEIFWRGFIIRWLIKEDFQSVPVGAFTWFSFLITVAFFGLEHDQWLAGLICGALYNWLYYRTKSIPACVIAHATSNAALAAYVLYTGDWKFW